ncbi:hypothetical protein [Lactobacillus sp. HT06-2]|uniref:hypothetical protein n=1 Tax=Lactobacillus sp. HT06-2 TaxID=2080222 RepID=UPI000CD7FAA2|nr:hypothetical protein [Lactobacillus sp. HT06-2]
MEMTNYQKALLIVHDLEDQYGSVAKAPKSNTKLKQIHELLSMPHKKSKMDVDQIIRLNYLGHSNAYIARATGLNKATIGTILQRNHLRKKQVFQFRVVAPDQSTTYYVDSLIHLYKLIKGAQINNNWMAESRLRGQGYSVKYGNYIWSNIADGCYYLVRGSQELQVKNGLDSYIYPNV